jgi:hypothetical protein
VLQLLMVRQDDDACTLVRKLDGLPLALTTAGAYLYQVSTSFAGYLELYNASWLQLQQNTPEPLSYEDRALYSTLSAVISRFGAKALQVSLSAMKWVAQVPSVFGVGATGLRFVYRSPAEQHS